MKRFVALVLVLVACGTDKPSGGECPAGTMKFEGNCIPENDPGPSTPSTSSTSSTTSETPGTPAGPKTPYDKEETEKVLRRAAESVRKNCGATRNDQGKVTGPWGATKVSVTLGRDGNSRNPTVPPPFDGTPPGRCAVNAFSKLIFPPYAAPSDSIVDWDIEIIEPGKEQKADAGAPK
jgi:hypothetical protein